MNKTLKTILKNKFFLFVIGLFVIYSIFFNNNFNRITNSALALFSGTQSDYSLLIEKNKDGYFPHVVFDRNYSDPKDSTEQYDNAVSDMRYLSIYFRDLANQNIKNFYLNSCEDYYVDKGMYFTDSSGSCSKIIDSIVNNFLTSMLYYSEAYRTFLEYNSQFDGNENLEVNTSRISFPDLAVGSAWAAFEGNYENIQDLYEIAKSYTVLVIKNRTENSTSYSFENRETVLRKSIGSILANNSSRTSFVASAINHASTTLEGFAKINMKPIYFFGSKNNLIDDDITFLAFEDVEDFQQSAGLPMFIEGISKELGDGSLEEDPFFEISNNFDDVQMEFKNYLGRVYQATLDYRDDGGDMSKFNGAPRNYGMGTNLFTLLEEGGYIDIRSLDETPDFVSSYTDGGAFYVSNYSRLLEYYSCGGQNLNQEFIVYFDSLRNDLNFEKTILNSNGRWASPTGRNYGYCVRIPEIQVEAERVSIEVETQEEIEVMEKETIYEEPASIESQSSTQNNQTNEDTVSEALDESAQREQEVKTEETQEEIEVMEKETIYEEPASVESQSSTQNNQTNEGTVSEALDESAQREQEVKTEEIQVELQEQNYDYRLIDLIRRIINNRFR